MFNNLAHSDCSRHSSIKNQCIRGAAVCTKHLKIWKCLFQKKILGFLYEQKKRHLGEQDSEKINLFLPFEIKVYSSLY